MEQRYGIGWRMIAAVAVAGFLLTGCRSGPTHLTWGDRAQIQSTARHWLKAIQASDWDAAARHYTPDAVIMPPGMPPIQGRDAIAAFFAAHPSISGITRKPLDLGGHGRIAYIRSQYQVTLAPRTGQAITWRGTVLSVWVQQTDGTWLISQDIYNTLTTPAD